MNPDQFFNCNKSEVEINRGVSDWNFSLNHSDLGFIRIGRHGLNFGSYEKPRIETDCFLTDLHQTRLKTFFGLIRAGASFGLVRNENDSVWMRNLFLNQSVWVRDGIIWTEQGMAQYCSEWICAIKRIQAEWEFCSDRRGIIWNEFETTIRTEREWIVIGRSHSDFHSEGVRASVTDFLLICNWSEWFRNVRIQTKSILFRSFATGWMSSNYFGMNRNKSDWFGMNFNAKLLSG